MAPKLKSALKRIVVVSGIDRAARSWARAPGAILMFHSVGAPFQGGPWSANSGLATAAAVLESFIDTLQAEGYALMTVSGAARRLAAGDAGRYAALTFDDGYRDNIDALLPTLERRGVKATVYVTAGFVDRTAPMWWFGVERALACNDSVAIRLDGGPRAFAAATAAEKSASYEQIRSLFYAMSPGQTRRAVDGLKEDHGIDCHAIADELSMDWDMVRELDRSGLVEIGGHAVSHCPLAAMSDAEAWNEIAGGRRRIGEMLGRPPRAMAYPYGIASTVSARDTLLTAKAGYSSAVTTEPRPLSADDAHRPYALPRIALGGSDDWRSLRIRLAGLGGGQGAYAAAP